MPRSLDAAEREQAVISASWRVIAQEGLSALTVRRVAAEAGLAPSSLRYTFPTQAAVRERSAAALSERIAARIGALAPRGDSVARARAMLLELLPLDEARRLEMSVFVALGAAAVTDAALQPLWRAAEKTIRRVCADALEVAGVPGDVAEVDRLHALVDGLALHLLVTGGAARRRRTLDTVDHHLRTVAGPLAKTDAPAPSR